MRLAIEQLESRCVPAAVKVIAIAEVLPPDQSWQAMHIVGWPAHSDKVHVVQPQGGPNDLIVIRV